MRHSVSVVAAVLFVAVALTTLSYAQDVTSHHPQDAAQTMGEILTDFADNDFSTLTFGSTDAPLESTNQESNAPTEGLMVNPEFEFDINPDGTCVNSQGEEISLEAGEFNPTSLFPSSSEASNSGSIILGEDSAFVTGQSDATSNEANVSPAMVGGFSTKGLKLIVDKVLPKVVKKIKNLKFPSVSGKSSGFKYTVKNVHFKKLSVGKFEADVKKGLYVGLKNIQIDLAGKWKYKKTGLIPIPFGSGSMSISVTGDHLNALFDIKVDKKSGKPLITVKDTSIHLSKVKIKTHGSFFSWLYNLILKWFSGTIKKKLNKQLSVGYRNGINAAAASLSRSIPTKGKVGDFGLIDLSLTSGATYFPKQKEIMLPFNGEVVNVKSKKSDGAVPRPSFTYKPTGHMLDVYVSDYVVNTAVHAYSKTGGVKKTLTPKTDPKFPLPLDNLDLWKLVIPGLNKFDKGHLEIDVADVHSSRLKEARIYMKTNAIEYSSQSLADVYHVFNGTRQLAFRTVFSTRGSLNLKIVNKRVAPATWTTPFFIPQIPSLTFDANVTASRIGDVSQVPKLVHAFNYIINAWILPGLNTKLKEGIPLPHLPGISLTKTMLQVKDRHMIIASDITFNLPSSVLKSIDGLSINEQGVAMISVSNHPSFDLV